MLKHQCALNSSALHLVRSVIDAVIHSSTPTTTSMPTSTRNGEAKTQASSSISGVSVGDHECALVAVGFPSTSSCKFTVQVATPHTKKTSLPSTTEVPSTKGQATIPAVTSELIERHCSELIAANAALFPMSTSGGLAVPPHILPFRLADNHIGTDDEEETNQSHTSDNGTAIESTGPISYLNDAGSLSAIFVFRMKARPKHGTLEIHFSAGDAASVALAKRDLQHKKLAVATKYKAVTNTSSATTVTGANDNTGNAEAKLDGGNGAVKRTAISDTAFHVLKGAVVRVLSCPITSSVHWTTATDATLQVVYNHDTPPSNIQLEEITRLCNEMIASNPTTKLITMERSKVHSFPYYIHIRLVSHEYMCLTGRRVLYSPSSEWNLYL
jgi:hypothetical protein